MSKQTDLINIPDAITVDGSNNVGIGVVPESSFPDRPMLRIGSGLGLMCRASGNPSHTWINSNVYQDPSSADDKYIATDEASQIRQTNGSIHFMTAESGSANATISWTNAMSVMKTGGITFNGDTAAANALDDYEEGTWTPTVTAASGSVNAFGTFHGTYTKIGREVSLHFQFGVTDIGSASGNLIVSNLPFGKETSVLTYYLGIHRARSGTSSISELTSSGTLQLYGTTPINSTYLGSIVYTTA